MQDFEKLGLFYLGRTYDTDAHKTTDDLVLYDSRDLVTHAVCVGMTGSGKTGLCLSLIEEAAIDGVPVIAIDPKGDLGNLLLTFPHLSADEFRPWIDEDEARRQGQTVDAFAASEAQRWTKGLADWGEDAARIERLRNAADFTIYTPGSRAGVPVSILSSFAAPPPATRADGELLAERAASTATSVLSLAGLDAQPRSREHTLVTSLFGAAWAEGRDLDLATLIQQVQAPPFTKVGVVDLEAFFPQKDRFALAMQLNGLLAAPGFAQWLEGVPLDPASLLYTAQGKPRVAVFSIAHLGDAERMFFVSLLLNQVVAWMRGQTGTTSLRAVVYMDEILGYFPPVANPPSKAPLMTLLKQGRAFGIGVVLATQNPVDLDYKGLANTGTWFLGRLQTERDKARMLDGLEGAASGSMDRNETDRLSVRSRQARVPAPQRPRQRPGRIPDEVDALVSARTALARSDSPADAPTGGGSRVRAKHASCLRSGIVRRRATEDGSGVRLETGGSSADPAAGPAAVLRTGHAPAARFDYRPVVLGAARVSFGDSKLGIDEVRDVVYAADINPGAVAVDWAEAVKLDVQTAQLRATADSGATYEEVPAAGLQAKNYAAWNKDFGRWLSQAEKLDLMRQRDLKLTSNPGETERDFQARVRDAQRVARDAAVDDLRKKFAARRAQIEEQRRRAQVAIERESSQATQQKLQTGLSVGATILGALFGRKSIGAGTIGRATTAARGVSRTHEGDRRHSSRQ